MFVTIVAFQTLYIYLTQQYSKFYVSTCYIESLKLTTGACIEMLVLCLQLNVPPQLSK